MTQFEERLFQQVGLRWPAVHSRKEWVLRQRPKFEHGFVFSDGTASIFPWDEAQRSFVYGQHMATACCDYLLQKNLAGRLYSAGHDDVTNNTAYNTIERAAKEGIITSEEEALLHKTRKVRNPIAYFRDISKDDHLDRRAVETRQSPQEILEKDAKTAL